jgi:DNA-binding NarL/FixJ family response regulator
MKLDTTVAPEAVPSVKPTDKSPLQKKIRVLLADDHNVVRQGLRALLNVEGDIDIVGEACNGRQAVQMASKLMPDVVVMDIAMPSMNGLEATRQITSQLPGTKVLVLSSYSNDDYVEELTEGGAAGYLIKQTASNELLKAIRETRRGNAFFSPAIAKHIRDNCRQALTTGKLDKKKTSPLTSRETEVLQLIAEGQPNKQIAFELSISVKTVEKHRQQLMNKLGIHDIAGLTRHAVSKGIIESTTPTGPLGVPNPIVVPARPDATPNHIPAAKPAALHHEAKRSIGRLEPSHVSNA